MNKVLTVRCTSERWSFLTILRCQKYCYTCAEHGKRKDGGAEHSKVWKGDENQLK